MCWRNYIRCAL